MLGKIRARLWSGMKLTAKDHAAWIIMTPFDHSEAEAIMRGAGKNAAEPKEMCISTIHHGLNTRHKTEDSTIETLNNAIYNYINVNVKRKMLTLAMQGNFPLKGLL